MLGEEVVRGVRKTAELEQQSWEAEGRAVGGVVSLIADFLNSYVSSR